MLKGMFQSQDFSADLCDEEAGEGGSRPPHPLGRRHSATLPSAQHQQSWTIQKCILCPVKVTAGKKYI